jgi:hypothetical protein
MDPPRDYISNTEQNQIRTERMKMGKRTRLERVLGSRLLWAVAIDCD